MSLPFGAACLSAWLVMVSTPSLLSAQDQDQEPKKVQIEILNQDGEKVSPPVQQPQPPRTPGQGMSLRIENKDGKIIVFDADGTKRELDVSNAESVIVNQSFQSVDDNGDKTVTKSGKVIIVGPDGKRQEIELGELPEMQMEFGDFDFMVPNNSGVWRFAPENGGFMIGVFCEPVSPALASQLRLPSNTGLVISDVSEDSPAAKAGLEVHDVLLYVDQQELSKREDLVKAVQEAGKQDAEITLSLIRGGKEQDVQIKPTKRPETDLMVGDEMQLRVVPFAGESGKFEFRAIEPGVIMSRTIEGVQPESAKFDADMQERMEAHIKQMEEQMKQLREEMKKQLRELEDDNQS